MTEELVICETGPSLPRETIVSKVGIIGMSGSGKTQTARKLAEAMLEIDQHIVVLDPAGAFYGLRSSADGQSEGFPIVVFGGQHQDAPLDASSGLMLAKLIRKERFNAIFDMSLFNDGQIRKFSTDFLNELYLHNRAPIHVFMDEFDIICPQAKSSNSEEARAACNNIVRRGRIRGIGSTMITQNPQDADKSVLNMAEMVIAMRTGGSQAIDAIGKWMGRNLDKVELAGLLQGLPELETGNGFLWAPQMKYFGLVHFLLCKTFDSGRTPKLGEKIIPPKVMAKVDIARLGERVKAQVEEQKSNDPAELKRKIAELESRAGKGELTVELQEHIAELERKAKEYDTIYAQSLELLAEVHGLKNALSRIPQAITGAIAEVIANAMKQAEADIAEMPAVSVDMPLLPAAPARLVQGISVPSPAENAPWSDHPINKPKQAILDAIATVGAMPGKMTIEMIACTAGTTPRARGFEENMRHLRSAGLVHGITLTPEGLKLARKSATPATFDAVLARLAVMLTGPQVEILRALHKAETQPERLAAKVGTTVRSRGFEENMRRLRKLEYVVLSFGIYSLIPWLEVLP